MSSKITKSFEFAFPITEKKVVGISFKQVHIVDLIVSGTACMDTRLSISDPDKINYVIDSVMMQDFNILPVLNQLGDMEKIEEAASLVAIDLFVGILNPFYQ